MLLVILTGVSRGPRLSLLIRSLDVDGT
jgi:hypothetical protein